MPSMTPFILNPSATFRQTIIQGVDVGLWNINATETLVLATNTKYSPVSIQIADLGISFSEISVEQVLDTGTKIDSDQTSISFQSVGSGAFIIKPSWRMFYLLTTLFCYIVHLTCTTRMLRHFYGAGGIWSWSVFSLSPWQLRISI